MTQPGLLVRPPWFEDLGSWWTPIFPEGTVHVEPLGLDSRMALHVR